MVHLDLAELSRADALAELGEHGFWTDVYGVTEAMHDHHTGVKGSFRRVVLGLRRARAERVPFALVFHLTRSNYRHAPEMVRVAHTLGAQALALAPTAADGRVPPAPAELVAPFTARAVETARALGLRVAEASSAEAALRALVPETPVVRPERS